MPRTIFRQMRRTGGALLAGAMIAAAAPTLSAQQVPVDPNLPEYEKVSGVSGNIKSVGSDTMNNTMALWAEGFIEFYPNVRIEIEGKGSSTAPPALISGTSNFGPMSRAMKAEEIDAFESRYGYKPTPVRTCIDALAVFVHKDNPIAKEGLTLQQVDAIFSKTRRGGHDTNIRTWGDLGLTGEWANKPISLYGRNSASGTYGYFKENALFGGDYKNSVKEQPGSSSVVQAVASDKYAIGYSGIGYKTADVATVPLAADVDGAKYDANPANAYSGDYPLARFLRVYVNHEPDAQLDPLRREFLKYMFSRKGQSDVTKDGYYPVSAAIAKQDLERLGVTGYIEE
ncbi:MAG: PstS family phosphate ABC transporter substrate-binding protein [Phycisphaeraceae bacterium]